MSAEMTILLVGILLLVLPILDAVLSLGLMSLKLRIPLGIIGILLIIYGGYSFGTVNMQGAIEKPAIGNKREVSLPVDKVQVISPLSEDSVECRILTMGVYPEGHEKDIWVVLKPSDEKYYPQSDDTNTSYKRNGEWQVITRFGGDKGEAYEIIVYETDSQASQFFTETIEAWKGQLSYPGLMEDQLPASGITEVDRMTVFLLENCRGVH